MRESGGAYESGDDQASRATSFDVLPAVDVRAGVVAARSAPHGVLDPTALVSLYHAAGARWIHVADLDRAFATGTNAETIAELIARFPQLSIQVSGGVTTCEDVLSVLHAGAARVNLSAAALTDFAEVEAAIALDPARVAVCLDIREGYVDPRGGHGPLLPWRDAAEELSNLGCRTLIVTDVDHDGAMTGPSVDLWKDVAAVFGAPIIASGGIGSLEDCEETARARVWVRGLVLGRALAAQAFTLEQALEVFAQRSEDSRHC